MNPCPGWRAALESTDPRMIKRLERSRRADWKEGYHSAEAKAGSVQARATRRQLKEIMSVLRAYAAAQAQGDH